MKRWRREMHGKLGFSSDIYSRDAAHDWARRGLVHKIGGDARMVRPWMNHRGREDHGTVMKRKSREMR